MVDFISPESQVCAIGSCYYNNLKETSKQVFMSKSDIKDVSFPGTVVLPKYQPQSHLGSSSGTLHCEIQLRPVP